MAKIEAMREETSAKVSISTMENDARRYVTDKQHEAAMMSLAEKMNMSREQIEAMLLKADKDRESKERGIAAEMAIRSSQQSPLNQTEIANT
jgi:hypothetical protein